MQMGGWRRSVHLPAALHFGLASLAGSGLPPQGKTQAQSPCHLLKEEKQQRALPTTFPQGLVPDYNIPQEPKIDTDLSAYVQAIAFGLALSDINA